jgi:hypothetical protein
MVRILCCTILSLAISIGTLTAGDRDKITAAQLENIVAAVAGIKDGTVTVTLMIGGKDVAYTVTKDAIGNITATGPANADIQTIAISSGTTGGATGVPLAATVIGREGGITSYNIATNTAGQITGITSTADTLAVKTGPKLDEHADKHQHDSNGSGDAGYFADGDFSYGGGAGGGVVHFTFAPGTSPNSSSNVSPH